MKTKVTVLLALLLALHLAVPARPLALEGQAPRGYYTQLDLALDGKLLTFGPFVGYYFKPVDPADLTRINFLCFNQGQFYTRDLPAGALLFEGTAILATLPDVRPLPDPNQRINPVFFAQAPPQWLAARPSPQKDFRHFHSAYSAAGATLTGYWLRHQPVTAFTYDMGGRLRPDSPLYHQAEPGKTGRFPRIIEFDFGPDWQTR